MEIGSDLRVLFDKWEEEMLEVQNCGMITEDMIVQSMHTLPQIFQPQLYKAPGSSRGMHR